MLSAGHPILLQKPKLKVSNSIVSNIITLTFSCKLEIIPIIKPHKYAVRITFKTDLLLAISSDMTSKTETKYRAICKSNKDNILNTGWRTLHVVGLSCILRHYIYQSRQLFQFKHKLQGTQYCQPKCSVAPVLYWPQELIWVKP